MTTTSVSRKVGAVALAVAFVYPAAMIAISAGVLFPLHWLGVPMSSSFRLLAMGACLFLAGMVAHKVYRVVVGDPPASRDG